MATIDVKDAAGSTVPLEKPLAPGAAAAAASRPVTLSTENVATLNTLATQTTLAAILAKIITAPATEATLASVLTAAQAAIPAGTALIGKVGIDQTTPGTTNKVSVGTDGKVQLVDSAAAEVIGLVTASPAANTILGRLKDLLSLIVLAASEAFIGHTGGVIVVPSSSFTRPADTTAYASGDIVANNTTAASVVALSWTAARIAAGNFYVRRARLKKSTTSLANAAFRLHLYGADPTASTGIINGDNGVWSTKVGSYLGAIDITVDKAFSDAAQGNGAPNIGSEINIVLASGTTLYGILEARGAYAPGNAEVFTVDLELWQN